MQHQPHQRPAYRIAVAGLDPRDVRLIEIVFRHSQYNRFEFLLDERLAPELTDILLVNTSVPQGLRAVSAVRMLPRHVPVVAAVPRGVPSPTRHAISIDRLTLQLLPILNRVVDVELAGAPGQAARASSPAQPAAAGVPPATPAAVGGPAAAAATDRVAPGAVVSPRPAPPAQADRRADLPAGPGRLDAGAAARAALVGATGQRPPRPRVLVVDDSRTVRRQLELALDRMGLACDAVADGQAALARLAECRYDLAMVDVVIPDINGYQLTRELRRRQRGLPVVILSSKDSPFDLARGLLAGCTAYLAKPVPLKELDAALRKALRKAAPVADGRPAPAPRLLLGKLQ